MSTVSNEIEMAIRPLLERRRSLWDEMLSSTDFSSQYTRLLAYTYHYVKQSCPLMLRAQKLAQGRNLSELSAYLEEHIQEEAGHEQWVLEDLEHLGFPRSAVKTTLPPAPVCSMVGSQIYLMEEFNPVSILGYIFVLEAYPPKMETLNWISERKGIPQIAMRTLKDHSDLDQEHRRELIDFVDSGVVDEGNLELILHSARVTSSYVVQLLAEISSR